MSSNDNHDEWIDEEWGKLLDPSNCKVPHQPKLCRLSDDHDDGPTFLIHREYVRDVYADGEAGDGGMLTNVDLMIDPRNKAAYPAGSTFLAGSYEKCTTMKLAFEFRSLVTRGRYDGGAEMVACKIDDLFAPCHDSKKKMTDSRRSAVAASIDSNLILGIHPGQCDGRVQVASFGATHGDLLGELWVYYIWMLEDRIES